MYTSVPPFGVRSRRVRYLSRSPVPYIESNTRPIERRMMSCGILERFSSHWVSMVPVVGDSLASSKPFSLQNCFSCGHSCSGLWFTTSQRWLPLRSMRMVSVLTGPTALPGVAATAPPCCGCLYDDAEAMPRASGTA